MGESRIPYRITNIVCNSFEANSELAKGDINMQCSFAFGVNESQHVVRSVVKYELTQNASRVLFMELACFFDIHPDALAKLKKDNSIVIEAFFARYLATINVGAARGEIHARCELKGLPLANVVLPPINLEEAIPGDVVIEL